MNAGWIGAWSPGIGDPTPGGWITVLFYACAAWACYRATSRMRRLHSTLDRNETLIWSTLLAGMVILGINKQLDLQSALTEIARTSAVAHGWYEKRQQYQEAFVAAMPIVGATVLAAMMVLAWETPWSTRLACAGAAGLVVFVAIRAASFHEVDEALRRQLAGLTLNWILEMGSLAVIIVGATARGQSRS